MSFGAIPNWLLDESIDHHVQQCKTVLIAGAIGNATVTRFTSSKLAGVSDSILTLFEIVI